MLKRVVVTGMGAVTPLGSSVASLWKGLFRSQSGIRPLLPDERVEDSAVSADVLSAIAPWTPADFSKLSSSFAGVVVGAEALESSTLTAEERRREPRFVKLALLAAVEAVEAAELEVGGPQMGISMGVGMASVRDVALNAEKLAKRGARRVDPLFVPRVLPNSAAGAISRRFDLRGPSHAVSTACATGAHSIGDAYNFIRLGMATTMLAGGVDAQVDPLSVAGFSQLRALAVPREGEDVAALSRPFDEARGGFVMGEGAGVMVLEERQQAIDRGAPILAEVVGYGATGDAYHVTAPAPDGNGAVGAMRMALGGTPATDIGYLNAHATSTPVGDLIEAQAIESVFGGRADRLPVSSSKGHLGHLLGAAGAVEAIVSIQSLVNQRCPPTLNLKTLDPEIERASNHVEFVRDESGAALMGTSVMSNSFGFGGTNVSLIFRHSQ